MTFKEKLQKEHPDMVRAACLGGCYGCPHDYGYEKNPPLSCTMPSGCAACWNREIPGTNCRGLRAKLHLIDELHGVPNQEFVYKSCINVVYGKPKINMPGIKEVIFNDPATIVIWADGEKTVVKCQNGEPYDPEKGLAMAISKRALGNKHEYYNIFKHWLKKYKKRAKSIWGYKRDSEHCLHIFTCGVCGDTVTIPFSDMPICPPRECLRCESKNGEV